MTGIDAASNEDTGFATVEIGSTEEKLTSAMTIAVTPGLIKIRFTALEAGTREVNDLIGYTRLTVTIDQELFTIESEPLCPTRLRRTIVSP